MRTLLAGILGMFAAASPIQAATNSAADTNALAAQAAVTNGPVEIEFKKLEADDDSARAEVDGWIRENNDFAAKGAGIPAKELNARIMKRFATVRKGYEDFIKQHPNHVGARLAFAAFLDDIGDEDDQVEHLEKAREIDPKNPAVWNQLANYYGHNSPVDKAFEYYEKAIELDPKEPVYYQNFATTVYLFRKDAMEKYHITEPEVFDKSLALYAQALKLDPTNFVLATDLAISYYGIKPLRTNDALAAWTNTLSIATDELEREGVYIHLARIKLAAGRYAEVHTHLDAVTNAAYAELKGRIARNLAAREHPPADTNNPATAEVKFETPAATSAPPRQ